MKVGIIAEGWDDCGVIYNLLISILPIESSDDVKYIRPKEDATDKEEAAFSNWPLVKKECIEKVELDKFLSVFPDEPKLIIIQIDTAECEEQEYEVVRPAKSNLVDYSTNLRDAVIAKINEWLGPDFSVPVAYAVAIEETEAWIIALLDDNLRRDSCSLADPKRRLKDNLSDYISRPSLKHYVGVKSNKGAFEAAHFLSGGFTRRKNLANARKFNHGLNLFCAELEAHANENEIG